jgi:hypothetical protein
MFGRPEILKILLANLLQRSRSDFLRRVLRLFRSQRNRRDGQRYDFSALTKGIP